MFGIGGAELFIILLFAFLIFGPDKLPEIGRTVGRALRQFREAQEQMNKVVRSEVYDPDKDTGTAADPFSSFFKEKEKAERKEKKEDSSEDDSALKHKEGDGASASAASESKDSEDSEVKLTAPAGETFAQKKARLAKEKAAAKASRAEELYGLAEKPGDDVAAAEKTPESGEGEEASK